MSPIQIKYETWVYSREILFNVLLFTILAFTIAFALFPLHRLAILLISLVGVLVGAWVGTRNAKKKLQKS